MCGVRRGQQRDILRRLGGKRVVWRARIGGGDVEGSRHYLRRRFVGGEISGAGLLPGGLERVQIDDLASAPRGAAVVDDDKDVIVAGAHHTGHPERVIGRQFMGQIETLRIVQHGEPHTGDDLVAGGEFGHHVFDQGMIRVMGGDAVQLQKLGGVLGPGAAPGGVEPAMGGGFPGELGLGQAFAGHFMKDATLGDDIAGEISGLRRPICSIEPRRSEYLGHR